MCRQAEAEVGSTIGLPCHRHFVLFKAPTRAFLRLFRETTKSSSTTRIVIHVRRTYSRREPPPRNPKEVCQIRKCQSRVKCACRRDARGSYGPGQNMHLEERHFKTLGIIKIYCCEFTILSICILLYIRISILIKAQVRRFSVEAKRKEINCVIWRYYLWYDNVNLIIV